MARRIKLTERKTLNIKIVCFRAIRYYCVDSESSPLKSRFISELLKAFTNSAKPVFMETTQVEFKE